jgi:hypothetical protein
MIDSRASMGLCCECEWVSRVVVEGRDGGREGQEGQDTRAVVNDGESNTLRGGRVAESFSSPSGHAPLSRDIRPPSPPGSWCKKTRRSGLEVEEESQRMTQRGKVEATRQTAPSFKALLTKIRTRPPNSSAYS